MNYLLKKRKMDISYSIVKALNKKHKEILLDIIIF